MIDPNDPRLANLDALAWVRESTFAGNRAIDVRVVDGIDLRLLPDRGLDIGAAWYRGTTLAWLSAVGEAGPLEQLEGMAWSAAFGGGLVTTCGLRNVGAPSEGHGLHGAFSHQRAADVSVVRGADRVTATGVINDGETLQAKRAITTHVAHGRVELTDVATNLGEEPEAAPVLYHCNFGWPLWGNGASLEIHASATHARDPESEASLGNWSVPPPVDDNPERVLEHEVIGEHGWGSARLANRTLGVAVTVRWRLAELPRLHQWVLPTSGVYVLGIEPANCSTSGRAHDRAEGRLPMLDPGEQRETMLIIEAGPA